MALQLGIIPDYQFSHDPSVNFALINPHVQFPEGMNQMTVQPIGQYVTSGDANLNGLGVTMANWLPPAASGAGISGLGVFSSTWWRNRKWLAFGLVGVLGLGAGAIALKVLK